jgi:hypothetical protein
LRKPWIVCVLLSVAICMFVAPAAAVGSDPSFNFAPQPSCAGASACMNQAVAVLDQARAKLGQQPYDLPRNFASLAPAEQLFVLTDLDRLTHGLRPIEGLTDALDQAAAAGVGSANDPMTADPNIMVLASNWAAGYPNAEFAYEAWMYADGLGSNNVDCTALNTSGCWAHRENILTAFGSGPLAMGAATGSGPGGVPGYAVTLVEGNSSYRPAYVYTWNDAVAAGASPVQSRPRARTSCVHRRRRAHHRHHRSARCRR